MLETVNQETNATEDQPKEEKLFTQEQVNGFFNKRYSEMMSQLEEYKAKAEKFDELEEANKSELQKVTERAKALESELKDMKQAESIRTIKTKVATETGVPAELLNGTTEEECRAQAEAIKAYAKPTYPNLHDAGEVAGTSGTSTAQQFAQWFRNQ